MGRWSLSNKIETDDVRKLSISWLNQKRLLLAYWSDTITWTNVSTGHQNSIGIEISANSYDGYVRLLYQTNRDGKKKDFDYKVFLTTTPCHFGGQRYWFICSGTNGILCGRRSGTLYLVHGYFICRHCGNLTYFSKTRNYNSGYAGLFATVRAKEEIKKIFWKKYLYYRGKPTKNHRKLMKYMAIVRAYTSMPRPNLLR